MESRPSGVAPGAFPTELVERFQPLRRLGEGAMGAVWLARDTRRNRKVAVKVMLDPADSSLIERFLREAEVLSRLEHPNILHVDLFGISMSSPYIVMEYVDGHSLEEFPEDQDPLPPMLQVADGLDAVHRHGLVHRDVKPSNVLLGNDGRARLADFGLVYDMDHSRVTQTGQVIGTVNFLAPERMHAGRATPAWDWYAWGISLYWLYERTYPYQLPEIVRAAAGGGFPELAFRRLDPGSPQAALIRTACDRDPDRRPTSRRDAESILARPPEPGPPGRVVRETLQSSRVAPLPPVPAPDPERIDATRILSPSAALAAPGVPGITTPRRTTGEGGQRAPEPLPSSQARQAALALGLLALGMGLGIRLGGRPANPLPEPVVSPGPTLPPDPTTPPPTRIPTATPTPPSPTPVPSPSPPTPSPAPATPTPPLPATSLSTPTPPPTRPAGPVRWHYRLDPGPRTASGSSLPAGRNPIALSVSPDGSNVAWIDDEGWLRVVDAISGADRFAPSPLLSIPPELPRRAQSRRVHRMARLVVAGVAERLRRGDTRSLGQLANLAAEDALREIPRLATDFPLVARAGAPVVALQVLASRELMLHWVEAAVQVAATEGTSYLDSWVVGSGTSTGPEDSVTRFREWAERFAPRGGFHVELTSDFRDPAYDRGRAERQLATANGLLEPRYRPLWDRIAALVENPDPEVDPSIPRALLGLFVSPEAYRSEAREFLAWISWPDRNHVLRVDAQEVEQGSFGPPLVRRAFVHELQLADGLPVPDSGGLPLRWNSASPTGMRLEQTQDRFLEARRPDSARIFSVRTPEALAPPAICPDGDHFLIGTGEGISILDLAGNVGFSHPVGSTLRTAGFGPMGRSVWYEDRGALAVVPIDRPDQVTFHPNHRGRFVVSEDALLAVRTGSLTARGLDVLDLAGERWLGRIEGPWGTDSLVAFGPPAVPANQGSGPSSPGVHGPIRSLWVAGLEGDVHRLEIDFRAWLATPGDLVVGP